jgi:hypothetical protein
MSYKLCLILNGYGVMDIAHNAQHVHLKSGVGVHKFPHFSRHPIQYLNEQFLDLQVGFGTRNSLRGLLCLILLKFCVWGYLKNMMHECKVNTSKKMLQGSWTTHTSEVGLHVPWPKKSECASTLRMVTQCTWISFPYRLIMSEKWIWLSNIHSSITFWVRPTII